MLHFVAVTAAAGSLPEPLATELAGRWQGLTPGFHRFSFDGGAVLLTVCIGEQQEMLREQAFRSDALHLDEVPAGTARTLARLCRRGSSLVATAASEQVRGELAACGFELEAAEGGGLVARYEPRWELKGLDRMPRVPAASAGTTEGGDCVVVGAGLAGAAVAASLARRGWQVLVLDGAATPAAGAASLPAGLVAPHQSPDDNLLSRLTRAGIRITLQECARLLVRDRDWSPTGALEHRRGDLRPLPAVEGLESWSREATVQEKALAGLPADEAAWWHANAAWVRPGALVEAWLAHPGIRFRGACRVGAIEAEGNGWLVRDAQGQELARTPLVVVAAAGGSLDLLPGPLGLHPVRGQVSWGRPAAGAHALPPFPVNGNGHFLPDVPLPSGRGWLTGSTYDRADADPAPRDVDQQANLQRLNELLPTAAQALAPQFEVGEVQAWSGVRWASTDRRPLAGELRPGLWVSTALGSRGLSFAALCGEWIAARLHGEPWPLEARLAQALDVARQAGSRS